MSHKINQLFKFFLIIVLVAVLPGQNVTQNSEKRAINHSDYDSWRNIRSAKISDDGKWLLYLDAPQDGDASIVFVNTGSRQKYSHPIGYTGEGTTSWRAAKAQFSADGKYAGFLISPTQAEVKKHKKDKKDKKIKSKDKLYKKLGILDLNTGKSSVIRRVKSFAMPKEAGGWVVYLLEEEKKEKKEKTGKKSKEPPQKEGSEKKEEKESNKKKEKKKKYGTKLVLRSLQAGKEDTFPNVLEYYFTKNGRYLYFTVSGKKTPALDGLYMVDTRAGKTSALIKGEGNYSKFSLNKDETILAFVTDRDDYKSEKPLFNLYGARVGELKAKLWVSHKITRNFPAKMAVSDKSKISFSRDGQVVMFGIKEIPPPEKEDDDEKEEAKFDLWHWEDPYPQPQQKKMAKRIRNNTWESVYHVKQKRFVKLADKNIPDLELHSSGRIAFGSNPWPYARYVSFYGQFKDVYVVNPRNGKKTLVKKKLYGYRGGAVSPGGRYVYWYLDKHWYLYDIRKKTTINLTKNVKVRFDRDDWDTPNPPMSYGNAGWAKGDSAILLYDKFDIWEIKPDGTKARMVTEGYGRKNRITFRYRKLDREEEFIATDKPILLSATNRETMATGYYLDKLRGKEPPRKLLMKDASLRILGKSKDAEKLVYTFQSFDIYPDLWVSDLDFKNSEKFTSLGKQTAPFLWGKSELRNFSSADGKPLKGILVKPENFDKTKKYPLMVYIYETLHTYMTHRFRSPGPGSSINPAYYVSNGYVLWMPDIEYDTGYPGKDALKCVLPGIQMLIREGFVDPKAIGIQGHSWGGYQIAYMITQTNIFAAAEAGAPVSNMTSAYGGIRWGSGMVRQFQYERTQSRLGDSLWKVPLRYIENSPLFWADKVNTPLMMMHNDEDGAVPWYQGIEYMMALRRLGREAYMFNYNGEKHGLRKRINQKDWTRRMAEFFDHHLKGTPATDWMKHGIKAWEKKEKKKGK